MNNNPIGWPDNGFNYDSSTQTLNVPRRVLVNAPSSYTGNLLDLQQSGTSRFKVTSAGELSFSNGSASLSTSGFFINTSFSISCTTVQAGAAALRTTYGILLSLGSPISWTSNIGNEAASDLSIFRDAANILAQRNGTNAQAFRVYNTYTSATNYERGKLEWSGNVFNVGTEKGSGGGTARSMALQTDAVDRLTLDTVGSVRVTTGLTVATLPASPTVGMIARVTNALSPTIGSTVAGGGAANALCWYNGTNWTVLGI